jgi:hypothetical protein
LVTRPIIMKKLFLFVAALIAVDVVIAQKLPNIQIASLRAPANVKVDGKVTEWGDQFQAYNNKTEIFYTIANDSEKLYLAIQATDEAIIKKIVMGGITFSVSSTTKRDVNEAASVTFPVYDINYPPSYFTFNKSKIPTGSNIDSLMNLHNKSLSTKYKLIGISGIENIIDSLLSVYNSEGLKAAIAFDSRLNYTYEMVIPLKYLKLNNTSKFTYNIKLNAATIDGRKLEITSPRPNLNIVQYTGADGVNYILASDPQNFALAATLVAPTDFWGEYTLAK